MEWISTEGMAEFPILREVELAFWDGVCMCRTFGAYDHEEKAWYSGQHPLEEDGLIVTHWRAARPLPKPPTELLRS